MHFPMKRLSYVYFTCYNYYTQIFSLSMQYRHRCIIKKTHVNLSKIWMTARHLPLLFHVIINWSRTGLYISIENIREWSINYKFAYCWTFLWIYSNDKREKEEWSLSKNKQTMRKSSIYIYEYHTVYIKCIEWIDGNTK